LEFCREAGFALDWRGSPGRGRRRSRSSRYRIEQFRTLRNLQFKTLLRFKVLILLLLFLHRGVVGKIIILLADLFRFALTRRFEPGITGLQARRLSAWNRLAR
jgi:hypothetical protein